MEISFWRHKSNVAGKSKIYCRVTVAGERAEIGSTGIMIYHDHWVNGKVSDADPESFFKNEQLTYSATSSGPPSMTCLGRRR